MSHADGSHGPHWVRTTAWRFRCSVAGCHVSVQRPGPTMPMGSIGKKHRRRQSALQRMALRIEAFRENSRKRREQRAKARKP